MISGIAGIAKEGTQQNKQKSWFKKTCYQMAGKSSSDGSLYVLLTSPVTMATSAAFWMHLRYLSRGEGMRERKGKPQFIVQSFPERIFLTEKYAIANSNPLYRTQRQKYREE